MVRAHPLEVLAVVGRALAVGDGKALATVMTGGSVGHLAVGDVGAQHPRDLFVHRLQRTGIDLGDGQTRAQQQRCRNRDRHDLDSVMSPPSGRVVLRHGKEMRRPHGWGDRLLPECTEPLDQL
jgi:hypothetical protein